MSFFGKTRGRRIHTRTIEVDICEYDDERLVVEGILTDHRLQDYHLATGDKKAPGILHQMIVHLLVDNADLIIQDVHVEMPTVPRQECLETIDCLAQFKGLKISGGFTAKIKALAGGPRGCSHLVALLAAMAPAAVQGYAAYHAHRSPAFASNIFRFLINTCRPWREGGPLAKQHGAQPE